MNLRWLALIVGVALLYPARLSAEIAVRIDSPPEAPSFGEVEVVAAIDSSSLSEGDSLQSIRFFVDGVERGTAVAPPWKIRTDVGQDNQEHVYRVEATSLLGDRGSTSLITPAIQVDMEITLELQQLYVTVLAQGERVLGLDQEAFRILDDGNEETIVTFEGGDIPLVAALLLDTSASMEGPPLAAALAGSQAFVSRMNELDRVSAYLFSDRLRKRTPWSGDPALLESAMEGLEAKGNTAVWDVLFQAIENLDARQGRRVAVLLSDGADLHSALGMDELVWKLRRSSTALYWLKLEGGENGNFRTSWRDDRENRHETEQLRKAVELSGGRILEIAGIDEVEPAFVALLAELRDQYALGYYPSSRSYDGGWRDVGVIVRGRGSVARSRTGYIDD